MPKFPKPFYRPSRKLWYVQIDGKQHNLGPDEKNAFEAYYKLMAQPRAKEVATDSVVSIIDNYLDWCEKHRAPDTYRWYKDRLQAFVETISSDLLVAEFKPYHVQKWVDQHPEWAKGTCANAIRSVKRAFRWAEEQGYLERSPVALMKKPTGGRKEVVVSEEHYKKILELTQDQEFKDLITVTWECGCRPQESLRVEARHFDGINQRWVIPTTPGKPDNRVVYLPDEALAIVKRLNAIHKTGPIFRNSDGVRWTSDAVNCRFSRLKEKLGVRYSLYAIRHTWITRLLQSGVDSLTVAILAGHKDPSMLARHYAHLTLNPKHLLEQAKNLGSSVAK